MIDQFTDLAKNMDDPINRPRIERVEDATPFRDSAVHMK